MKAKDTKQKIKDILNMAFCPLIILMTLSLVAWVWHPIGGKLFGSFFIIFLSMMFMYAIFFYYKDKQENE